MLRENLILGAQNMAVGLIVVFAVLTFLMFVIYLFKYIQPRQGTEDGVKTQEKKDSVTKSVPAAGSPAAASAECTNEEEEVAAVIAAAVAAAMADAPSPSGYVVRTVRQLQR